ncbi:MAG: TIGR00282 family metallophosphoesterase [Candidatus Doudnabacteria bacterium CG10_big_fil_rev_8_21_14_0_10_42_18]|uniref:TIGR00282 family metallophosphoesterase n=1 Tax=Candidatus Doudnabacteria bacterium CG10_big_fil_rev_8_21_14_0_10_42_18 TaxID=1974552 RepID=A0A2H0VAG1_9BACT|nr:MAG: TIGR00282 family metallophosphoesterase [Candidatus Doudnabacteria bacterium CG10_big_fil_rev_8_21_14_0_10_42_18]
MPKILFIGDIVGKAGRKVLLEVLPKWKEKHKPDVIIVNVENLAHGKGVTPSTMAEVDELGADVYTSGNHIFKKNDLSTQCFEKYPNLIRPANFEGDLPGKGFYRFEKGGRHYLIANFNGKVFFEQQYQGEISNPFFAADKFLEANAQKGDIILIDFHSEATSEKVAFAWHMDGRITAVLGTHTHVPTADARILPQGTAYISDVGMTGARDSVIGVKKENALTMFLEQGGFRNEPENEGVLMVNGVLIEVSNHGKAEKIERAYKEISN